MQKEKRDKHFIKKPVYEGGPQALKKFIAQHLRYPEEARAEGIEGTVVIKFDIDHQGKVVDTQVVSGLGYGCDEEAARVVRLLRFQVPKSRGVKVLFHKSLNIHFRRPKIKKKAAPAGMTYTYVEKAKPEGDSPQPGGYTYTIDL